MTVGFDLLIQELREAKTEVAQAFEAQKVAEADLSACVKEAETVFNAARRRFEEARDAEREKRDELLNAIEAIGGEK